MALITLPTKFGFSRVSRFGLTRNSNVLRSRYTGQAQRVIYPYAVWEFEGALIEYDGIDAAYIRSFLMQLEGQKHTFRLPVPGYTNLQSGYKGAVNSSGTTAVRSKSLVVNGLPASTAIFSQGDFITVQDELKTVTANSASNSTGQATISFEPPLRKSVASGVAVTINNPYCVMHAAEDDVASWAIAPPIRQSSEFAAIEAVEI